MKFVVAVVMLALALGTESSIIPWGAPLSYTAVSGPAVLAHVPAASVAVHASAVHAAVPAVVAAHAAWPAAHAAWPAAHAWAAHGVPAVAVAAHGPAVVAAHGPAVVAAHAHEGSYVAKTRGAVHVAPLAGHANSAASINLQPAPGTV